MLKKSLIVCLALVSLIGFGYIAYEKHKELTESSFHEGFVRGMKMGELSAEYSLRYEYQEYIFRMDNRESSKSVENYLSWERKIDRIIDKSNKNLSDKKRVLYKKYIIKWSREYNLSPVFVASIIHRETNFRETLTSKANCRGAMQVSYRHHKDKCDKLGIKEKDLHTINHGINVGCQIIRQYLEWNDWCYRAAMKKYVGSVNNSADGYINDILSMVIYANEKDK